MTSHKAILEKLSEMVGNAPIDEQAQIDDGLFELLDAELSIIHGGLADLHVNNHANNHTNNHHNTPP